MKNKATTENSIILQEIDSLIQQGLINNITNKEKLLDVIKNKSSVYWGIDPTSHSLHIGHCVCLKLCEYFSKKGCKIYFLIGGITAKIGDPSFRKNRRSILSDEQIKYNFDLLSQQLKKIKWNIEIINNFDFYKNWTISDFFNKLGNLINVNYLHNKESMKSRWDSGLTMTEFSYPLLQGYDFYELYKNHQVHCQIGGQDQWGNITTGCEIIRKQIGNDHKAVGITCPLFVDDQGNKMGKSDGKPIFLNKDLTTPNDLNQFFLNLSDNQTKKLMFTLTGEKKDITGKNMQEYKLKLKNELLSFIDIYEESNNLSETSKLWMQFKTQKVTLNENCPDLTKKEIDNLKLNMQSYSFVLNESIINILLNLKWCSSSSEAKRLIKSKGIKVDNNTITCINWTINSKKPMLFNKGKKNFAFLYFKNSDI